MIKTWKNIDNLIRQFEWGIALMISLIVSCVFWYLNNISTGFHGGMDTFEHYLIAKHSWQFSHLFLDQWGKPLYTIFASPFAQFGLRGLVFFNILCLVGTALFTFDIARFYRLRHPLLALIFVLFLPIFSDVIISGLTEPFNALVLSLCLWLFAREKYAWAAVISGFLPFVRSEGFVIIAAIGFYLFFIRRKYKYFVFLLVGSFVFNILGWIIEGAPLWIFTHNPYIRAQVTNQNLCGSGSWYHYFKLSNAITGVLLITFVAIGAAYLIIQKLIKNNRSQKISEIFWIYGGILVLYYGAHGFIWWKGIMGSCGYIRVMAVLAPVFAIIALYGINQLSKMLTITQRNILILIIVINTSLYKPISANKHVYPLRIDPEQELFVEVADWLKNSEYMDRTKVYLFPYLSVLLDVNHFDKSQHKYFWHSADELFDVGDILIWDAHFGPNESRTPLEKITNDPSFRLIKKFRKEPPSKTVNDLDFEVYVFEKM
jgi:hypothetical protein